MGWVSAAGVEEIGLPDHGNSVAKAVRGERTGVEQGSRVCFESRKPDGKG